MNESNVEEWRIADAQQNPGNSPTIEFGHATKGQGESITQIQLEEPSSEED